MCVIVRRVMEEKRYPRKPLLCLGWDISAGVLRALEYSVFGLFYLYQGICIHSSGEGGGDHAG